MPGSRTCRVVSKCYASASDLTLAEGLGTEGFQAGRAQPQGSTEGGGQDHA